MNIAGQKDLRTQDGGIRYSRKRTERFQWVVLELKALLVRRCAVEEESESGRCSEQQILD